MEFTTRNDAVEALRNLIAAADGTLAGRDPAEVYDIEAIADEVLITTGTGHLYRYVLPDGPDGPDDPNEDNFWAALDHHTI